MCPRSATPCLVPDYCEESFTCKETGKDHLRPFRQQMLKVISLCLFTSMHGMLQAFVCQEVNSDKCASLLTLFLGRCISHLLQCNGEPDCDDFSDEDGCENVNQRNDKCSTLIPIPGAERGTQG